jgi:glycosyltransferase involved in cell wall biosynthesis
MGLGHRVDFLGYISAAERAAFFARIDVLALPSNYENFGMAAAEAMAHGVPVLVSERTGLAELLRVHGGGRTVPLEVKAIAESALSLGLRARDEGFAVEVQRVVRDNLSYGAHAERALALYAEIIAMHADANTDIWTK